MKTTTILATLALAGTMTLTSCRVEDGHSAGNEPIAVCFTASIGSGAAFPGSRAANAAWTAGDEIGIRMIDGSGTTVAPYANHLYTTDAGGVLTASGTNMFYPTDGSTVNFIAYYPHTSSLSSDTYPITIAATQTSANQPDFDLLWAKTAVGYTKTSATVPLQVAHKLSKLILTTTPGAGVVSSDLTGMKVEISGMNTTASFDITTGTISGETTPDILTPFTATDGEQYEAIILPTTVAALGDVIVSFTIHPGTAQAETFTWKVPAATVFAGGSKHTWAVTLSRSGVAGIQASIDDWTEGTGGSGIATQ